MAKEYLIIGLGRFGGSLARTLYGLGHNVLGVDADKHRVDELVDHITHAVEADATDEAVLKSLGVGNFDTVIVSIGGNLEASILITLLVKELGARKVVAKAASDAHGKVLSRVGADRVIFPEKDMGVRVARSLVTENVVDVIELARDVSIIEMEAGGKFGGKNLKELDLRAKFGVTVLAIRSGESIRVPPSPNDVIQPGSIVIVLGNNKDLDRFQKTFGD